MSRRSVDSFANRLASCNVRSITCLYSTLLRSFCRESSSSVIIAERGVRSSWEILYTNCFCASKEVSNCSNMWRNEEGSRIIEFVQNGAVFDAIIRKAENPSLVGKRQISGLKLTGKDQYDEGMLHLFKRDKTAKCSIKMVGADKIEIKAGIGLMSKSQIWVKSK